MSATLAAAPRWSASRTAALLAVALPQLIAIGVYPSPSFLNEISALIGWPIWLLVLLLSVPTDRLPSGRIVDGPGLGLLGALALLAVCALASPLCTGRPWSLALSAAGGIVAALLTAWAATILQRAGAARDAFAGFCWALLVAGVLGSLVGVIQVYVPEWTGTDWISASSLGNRAVGNLRQPNHHCTVLLWAMVATVWLDDSKRLSRRIGMACFAFLLFGVVLTAARSGALGVLVLALWGALDRTLPKRLRALLLGSPVAYLVLYGAVLVVAHQHQVAFIGEAQLHKSDISSSRFSVWHDSLTLISEHPWIGVGFGEFNFAWTLHAFPNRSGHFFTNAHNLPLQLAVELGLVLAAVVLGLLAWALWRAIALARDGGDASGLRVRRAGLVMLLLMLVFSMLEIQLWFAHLLLPTAFLFGLLVTPEQTSGGHLAQRAELPKLLPVGLVATLVVSVASVYQYYRVLPMFEATREVPLARRIEIGSRSWFFSHTADFALATTAPESSRIVPRASTHSTLDTRLMMAWALALDQKGETDKARYIAARLREFRNPESADFFAVCVSVPANGDKVPFQCEAPQRTYDYRDFR